MGKTKEKWNELGYKTLLEKECIYCNQIFFIPKCSVVCCCSRKCSNLLKNKLFGNPATWEESKRKNSEKHKNKIPWQKILGNEHPKVIEYKERMRILSSIRNKGKHPWNFKLTKEDPRVYNNTRFFRENNPSKRPGMGKIISERMTGLLVGDKNPAKRPESRLNIKLGVLRAFKEGRLNQQKENNGNWQNGISFEPYGKEFDTKLKKYVRERDGNICSFCGKNHNLCIHHIDYNKKNNVKDNLITLCFVCNSKANGNRIIWRKFYGDLIKNMTPSGEISSKSTYSLGVDIARIFD